MTIELLTTQNELEELINRTNWHSAYLKEIHYADPQRQCSESGNTICGLATLVRVLIALPEESYALEIVSFETQRCEFLPNQPLEEVKSGTIKRRAAVLDFGAFSLHASCVGYRHIDVSSVQSFNYYSTEELFDGDGDLIQPYSVDWRTALDDASRQSQGVP